MAIAKNTTQEELKELSRWKKIEESNHKVELKRFIDDREVVSKRELIELWESSRKTIERNVAKGMPTHKSSMKGFVVFDLEACNKWKDENINKAQSRRATPKKDMQVDSDEDEDGEPVDEKNKNLDDVSTEEAERRLKIKENKIKDFKLKELAGEYIKADATDKITAEIVATFIGWLVNSREILSRDLEMKTKGEIFKELDDYFGRFIRDFGKRVNEELDEEVMTVYELVYIVQHKLESYKDKILKLIGK